MKTVIVGGVAGGASAAARLRRLDETAEIILLERGEFVSFAHCGLPYYIGGAIKQQENLTVQTPEGFRQRFNIDVRIFSEAVKINRDAKEVVVRNVVSGEEYTEMYQMCKKRVKFVNPIFLSAKFNTLYIVILSLNT